MSRSLAPTARNEKVIGTRGQGLVCCVAGVL